MNKADFNYLTGVTLTNRGAACQNSFTILNLIRDLMQGDHAEDVIEDLNDVRIELEALDNHLSNIKKSQEKLRQIHHKSLVQSDLINHEEISNEVRVFQGELV